MVESSLQKLYVWKFISPLIKIFSWILLVHQKNFLKNLLHPKTFQTVSIQSNIMQTE